MASVYILIFVTGVYAGDVVSTAPGFFNDKPTCDSAGTRWMLEAKAVSVRNPRYICLPRQP